jgi:transcriptional regulator with GAF, ATPase, and Fis domain
MTPPGLERGRLPASETECAGPVRFDTLLAALSSRFVNLSPGDVDSAIDDALRRICGPLGVDFAALWEWSADERHVLTLTHCYVTEGGPPAASHQREEHFPWIRQQVQAGITVALSSLEELPAEAAVDRASGERLQIKSALGVPLSVGGSPPTGILGFNTVRAPRVWSDDVVEQLRLVAQVFANALARKRHDLSLHRSESRLEAAAELAGLGFYEVDFASRVAYFDERLRRLLGTPPDRMDGFGPMEHFLEHVHPEDHPVVMRHRAQLHDGTLERAAIEYRYLHPTRGEMWIRHVARIGSRDAAGWVLTSYGVIRDISDRRHAGEALRKSYAEIARLKDRLEAERDYLKAEIGASRLHEEITGQSAAIRKVLRQAEQVAPTPSSVLVLGETGTGKERLAQCIHRLSPRHNQVMVKVNCAALPAGLIESELFGREKGAYTGAMARQVGRFEIANASTLFLDEIGEVSLELQSKLLRVLESGEFERLGSPRTIKVDVRLIAATNRDLADDVRKGRFREDLYYRLNVFPIRIPPLRERQEDIPQLVWTILGELNARMGKRITQVSRKTMEALQRQSWPGNVRELRNVLEHAVIVTAGETLAPPTFDDARPAAAGQTLAESERDHILGVLERTGWRIKGANGAAEVLGLKRGTLYGRMRKLGIPLPASKKRES